MRVLVVKAVSSSLELSVVDGRRRLGERPFERWSGEGERASSRPRDPARGTRGAP